MPQNHPNQHRTAMFAVLTLLLAPALAGCVADGGEGQAAFYVKDAPSDEFEHVNVTFSQVQVHQATENETDGSGWITVFSGSKTVDLLDFEEEGSKAFLGEANLTEGRYTQIRITVEDAVGVDKEDGTEAPIVVSSGTAKVVRPWNVTAGEAVSVTLDIDLDRSLREQGNGQWRMTPVIGRVLVEDGPGPMADRADQADGASMAGGDAGAGDQADGNQTSGQEQGGPSGADERNQTGAPGAQQEAGMTTYVKDAPTDEFREIWVTFDRVQVHYAGNGSDGNASDAEDGNATEAANTTEENATAEEEGRWIVTVNETRSLDLLSFNTSEAKAFLGEADVPTGQYTQIRVNVTEAWGILDDGNETRVNITVSSGTAKVNRPFEVTANGTTQVVIDVDLDRSLIRTGGQGQSSGQGQGQSPSGERTTWRMTPVIGSVAIQHVDEDPKQDVPAQASA